MRTLPHLNVAILVIIVGVAGACSGCAMSVRLGPIPKPPAVNGDVQPPMKPSEIVDGVDCSVYPLPLKDVRPVLPLLTEAEIKDKNVLSQILIKFIREEDAYISNHESKEVAIYSNWYMHCASHLHFH